MIPSGRDSATEALLQQARRHEEPIPDGAEVRIWRGLRRAEAGATARRAWSLFFAGAALAGALLLVLRFAHQPVEPVVAAGRNLPDSARPSLLELHDVAELVTGPHARVAVQALDDQKVELRVDSGTLLLHVLSRAGRGSFLVRTPRFVARVVGTVFRVTVEQSGESRIAVAHGTVEVTPTGQLPTLVHARQSWPDGAVAGPSADELALLGTREQVLLDDFFTRPHACTGDAEARVRCEVGYAQEASASEAENALYRAGLTAWHELGDPRRALALWGQERERFPNGALRREAQASMIDALVALGSVHEAEAAIESYLAVEPDDLRAPELHFVLGTILRRLDGSCRRAAGELDLALQHPAGRWVAQAEEARRACGRYR